jgi:hypothetical protein
LFLASFRPTKKNVILALSLPKGKDLLFAGRNRTPGSIFPAVAQQPT